MNVKEVVTRAIDHINELFGDENISNLGLEEVEFNPESGEWEITVGFSRPWDYPQDDRTSITTEMSVKRTYKLVTVSDSSGEIIALKNRTMDD